MQITVDAVFGTLKVVRRDEQRKSTHNFWWVKCQTCQAERSVRATDLRNGRAACCASGGIAVPVVDSSAKPDLEDVKVWFERELARHFAVQTEALLDMFAEHRATLLAQLQAPQQPLRTGLQPYSLKPGGFTNHPKRSQPKPKTEWAITAKTVLKGCSTREEKQAAHEANHQRALEIAATPYKDRTPELHQELLERWTVSLDRLELMLPSDPPYIAISNGCRQLRRAYDDWHLDPATM